MGILKQFISPVSKKESSYLLTKIRDRDIERDLKAIDKYNKSYKKIT